MIIQTWCKDKLETPMIGISPSHKASGWTWDLTTPRPENTNISMFTRPGWWANVVQYQRPGKDPEMLVIYELWLFSGLLQDWSIPIHISQSSISAILSERIIHSTEIRTCCFCIVLPYFYPTTNPHCCNVMRSESRLRIEPREVDISWNQLMIFYLMCIQVSYRGWYPVQLCVWDVTQVPHLYGRCFAGTRCRQGRSFSPASEEPPQSGRTGNQPAMDRPWGRRVKHNKSQWWSMSPINRSSMSHGNHGKVSTIKPSEKKELYQLGAHFSAPPMDTHTNGLSLGRMNLVAGQRGNAKTLN